MSWFTKVHILKNSVALLVSCCMPFSGFSQSPIDTNSLTAKLFDVVEKHLRTVGPDHEVAQFVSTDIYYAWPRRDVFFTLSRSYLDGTNVTRVAGAIDVLCRFRGFRPDGPVGIRSFEEVNTNFFAKLDAAVLGHFSHFKSLHNDEVYDRLSLYLGCAHSAEARRQLREIVSSTKNNEQALICLAWHHNPADMDFLLPYMLADTPASRSLPYHFRNGYGQAAIPYLRRAVSEAKSQSTREQAQKELKYLKQ